jgi:hypothetical protein
MRRRLVYLMLVIAAVIGAMFLHRRPVDVDLQLQLGAKAGEVKALSLVITDDKDRVARDVALAFPDGAPTEVRRRVPLLPGRYTVAARLGDRQVTRPLDVQQAGTYPLSLE